MNNVIPLDQLIQSRHLEELLAKGSVIPTRYEGDIKRFVRYVNDTGQSESVSTLLNYLAHSLDVQKVKRNTFDRRLAAIKKYLDVVHGMTFTESERSRLAQLRQLYQMEEYKEQTRIEGQVPTDKEELLAMVEKLDSREKAIALVNLITANRPSEMVRMRVQDFDLKGRSVQIYLPKQKEWHVKRLTLETVKAVKEYTRHYRLKPEDFFVTRERYDVRYVGKPLGEVAYNRLIHRILGFAPYTLRKTQVTAMHEAGADIPTIAKQTGHRSLETITKHYLRVNDKTVDKFL